MWPLSNYHKSSKLGKALLSMTDMAQEPVLGIRCVPSSRLSPKCFENSAEFEEAGGTLSDDEPCTNVLAQIPSHEE